MTRLIAPPFTVASSKRTSLSRRTFSSSRLKALQRNLSRLNRQEPCLLVVIERLVQHVLDAPKPTLPRS
jgi:hypothetical protein